MATVLPGRSYTDDTLLDKARPWVATGCCAFRRSCETLAQALDVALTKVFVLSALALAATLVATAAGLALPPPA